MDRLTELENIFNNFNMIGQDGITVHGDLHRGYVVGMLTTEGAIGFPPLPLPPPPPPPSHLCPTSSTISVTFSGISVDPSCTFLSCFDFNQTHTLTGSPPDWAGPGFDVDCGEGFYHFDVDVFCVDPPGFGLEATISSGSLFFDGVGLPPGPVPNIITDGCLVGGTATIS